MDRYELDQAVNRQMDEAYWPWWFAMAYVQPWSARQEAMRGGVETHLAFKGSSVDAAGALGRVVAVLCGDDDPDNAIFRTWRARAEDRLMLAIRAGHVKAWGRPAPRANLVELKPSDWVGGEVDCSGTCDLLQEGCRDLCGINRALNGERVLWFADIHLPREQVMGWADHLEQEAHRQIEDIDDAQNSEFFYALGVSDGDLVEGFWSAFVACAWVGSGCREFTAKAQQFERDGLADLGGVYSATAWSVMGGALRHKFGVSAYDALRCLQRAIAVGALPAGGGVDVQTGRRREIAKVEWQVMKAPVHDSNGTAHLPGLYNIMWSSRDVQAAFPACVAQSPAIPAAPVRQAATCTDDELTKRCDDLWLVGVNVRDMEKRIPNEPDFAGVKAQRIRDLTHDRYPRTGRGERKREQIRGLLANSAGIAQE